MLSLLNKTVRDFWEKKRKVQILMLLLNCEGTNVTQENIGDVIGVQGHSSRGSSVPTTSIRKCFPRPWKAQRHPDVFPAIEKFIRKERMNGRPVTLGGLMEFAVAKLKLRVLRKGLGEFMTTH